MSNDCPFCDVAEDLVVRSNEGFVARRDIYPVSDGHTLILPRGHLTDPFDLNWECAMSLAEAVMFDLLQEDDSIEGFNVGVNFGEVAGQTIEHLHVHVIPRRRGDTPEPRGGVRGVIPDKMSY